MVVNQKATGKAVSMPMGLLLGSCFSMGMTLAASAVLAKLLDSEKLAWENVGYGIVILLIASSFGGAMVSCGKIKRQRLLVCAASGAVYYSILLAFTALFFGGQYESIWITGVLILAGSAGAALLGLHGDGKGRRRKMKLRNR